MTITILLVSLIIGLGGFTQGLTGFGLGLVAVPLLTMLVGAKSAVPIAGIFAWIVTWPVAWKMRKHVQYKVVLILLIGAIPGSFMGAKILAGMSPALVAIVVGLTLITGSCYAMLSKPNGARKPHPILSIIVGFFSGVLGTLGGGPIVAYMALLSWTPDKTKSTMACFFMLQMVGVIFSFWKVDLITPEVTHYVRYAMPVFLVGLIIGMRSYVSLQNYNINYSRIVHILLIIMGCALLLQNVHF